MKKIITAILIVVLAVMPLAGCNNTESLKSLQLSSEEIKLSLFGEAELIATHSNIDGVLWENNNSGVVQMDTDGDTANLTAIGPGIAFIKVTGGGLTEECKVIVAPSDQTLALFTAWDEDIDLLINDTLQINAYVLFGGAAFGKADIIYKSSDEDVAYVSQNGEINGIGPGEAEITIQGSYRGYLSNQCSLTVSVREDVLLKVNAARLYLYDSTENNVYPNQFDFTVAIQDGAQEITNPFFDWTTSNADVAVYEEGKIVAKSIGSATITISCEYDGKDYTADITVFVSAIPVITLRLNRSLVELFDSAPTALYQTTAVLNASLIVNSLQQSVSNYTWTVTKGQDVVSVNQNGLVTASSPGNAIVTASYVYGGKTYTAPCEVIVTSPITFGAHKYWPDRDGVLVTLKEGSKLTYEGLTLTNDRNTPFIRLMKIPKYLLQSYYDPKEKPSDPIPPDNRNFRDLRMFYITLTDTNNPDNSIMIGIRVYLPADGFIAEIETVRVGARASTYPQFFPGAAGYTDFYGAFNGNPASSLSPLGISGGYGTTGVSSFFGRWLSEDNTDRYMLGFSLEGTAVYMHNDNTIVKIWDLAEDIVHFSALSGRAWGGFSSNNVKLTINGNFFDAPRDEFCLIITELEGRAAGMDDIAKLNVSLI